MKNVSAILLILCVAVTASQATQYYLATAADGGSDSNSGTSPSTPWLTPNHAVNCGDVIIAKASNSYAGASFSNTFGTVTCPAGNNVAWLECATFDGCKISGAGGFAIGNSYWGVQGWEVSSIGENACFAAYPPNGSIHHVIFANNVANGCGANGFATFNLGNNGVDYVAFVGNIAYNAAQNNAECYSGFSIYQPVQSDSVSGTHIYVAGNFAWDNVDPNPCAGGTPSDGEGLIFDTFDGSQGGLPSPFAAQAVAENNIFFHNGGAGIAVFNNQAGTANATIYLRYNTLWGNQTGNNQNATYCGEVDVTFANNVQLYYNVVQTNYEYACTNNPLYDFFMGYTNSSDAVYSNIGYSAYGTYDGVNNSPTFSYAISNAWGVNPNYVNPSDQTAPSCGGTTSVPNCMSTVISNFTTQASAANGWGRQPVSSTQTSDSLFPQWLCNVNLPTGLITMHCVTPVPPAPPTGLTAAVK